MPRVVSARGDVYEVADQEVAEHLANGYSLEGAQAGFDRAYASGREDRYSGASEKIDAAAAGLLRGATLGLSDVALTQADGSAEYLKGIREYNPLTSGVGELAGALVTAIPSGGNSLLARMPAGIAARAGMGATKAIQSGGGALRSIGGHAVGGAIEGAAQGAGSYVSDVALGDKNLSAEAFLGSMGEGALWGGAIGGGFGAVERGAIAARRLFPKSEVTREAVQAAQAEATTATKRAIGAGDEAEMVANRRIEEMRAGSPAADKAAKDAAETWRLRQTEAQTRKAEAGAGLAEQKLKTQRELDTIKLERERTKGQPKRKADEATPDAPSTQAIDEAAPPATADAPSQVADSAKPVREAATVQEAMEDAMAAVDPDIAAMVKAKRDYTFARSRLPRLDGPADASGTTWRVAGHQGSGAQVLNDAELAETTLGRVKTALGKRGVTPGQRAAVEKLMTPKRLEALGKLERGEVEHMPWWFNKEHVFEGKTFRISDLVESDDIVESRRLVHGVRSDLEPVKYNAKHNFETTGKLASYAEAKPRVDQFGDAWDAEMLHSIGVIGDFERSAHDLTRALGDAAPQQARAMADEFSMAARHADEANAASIGQTAEHIEAKTALDDARAKMQPAPAGIDAPVTAAPDAMPGAALPDGATMAPPPVAAGDVASAEQRLRDLSVVPSNVGEAVPQQAKQSLGAMDGIAALELLSSFEGLGLPSVANIPVIGPMLSLFLKAKAAGSVFKRLGGKVPQSAEAVVASKAARTKDRVRATLGKFLDSTETIARTAARHGPRAAVAALAHTQYDDGKRNAPPPEGVKAGTPEAMMAARIGELQTALADEPAARRRIAEQVRVTDPVLAKAIGDRFVTRAKFLLGKAPLDPRMPSPWGQRPWRPSPTQVDTFARYVRFANDPGALFDDMTRGELPREGVETLKKCYPDLYQYAQGEALNAMANGDRDLPYDRRVSMSVVFDIVGDPTMRPEYVGAMQADYAASPDPMMQAQPPQPPQPGLAGDPRRMVDSYQTAFDRRS